MTRFFICIVRVVTFFFSLQVLCVRSEFKQLKRPSLSKACRLTVQKTLYLCMIIACGSRGTYYSIQVKHNLYSKILFNSSLSQKN